MANVQPFSQKSILVSRDSESGPLFRLLDLTISLIAVVIFAPLLVVLTILIYMLNLELIFSIKQLIGYNGRSFGCFGFRIMVVDTQKRLVRLLEEDLAARAGWERDHTLRDDPRIIPLGRFLRKSSLDERPQFLNLIDSTTNAVGRRPIVVAEIIRYRRWLSDYRRVKRGITGLCQVSARSDSTYRRRVVLDSLFVRPSVLAEPQDHAAGDTRAPVALSHS